MIPHPNLVIGILAIIWSLALGFGYYILIPASFIAFKYSSFNRSFEMP